MKNAMKLLEAIGQIQDEYIMDAHEDVPKRASFRKKLLLIAAAAAAVLLFAGCTAYAWNWYTIYFTQVRQEPLSHSQIEYIDNNTQKYQQSQTYDGYTMELKSTISEQHSAYVTFGLTAPENVDLSPAWAPGAEELLSFEGLLAVPTGSDLPANLSYEAVDDGDGRNNTLNVVLRVDPLILQGQEPAFGTGKTCEIQFKGVVRWSYDREYEQELLRTKYAGQTDYMLTPEESSRVHPKTILASGEWKFEIELNEADVETMELLPAPIPTKVLVIRTGESEYNVEEGVEDVNLTSIQLHPMGLTIAFEKPEPVEKFDCIYVDAEQFSADGTIFLMMKDGTKIAFFQSEGAKETAVLKADSPIVLKEANYLQLSDGTKITIYN